MSLRDLVKCHECKGKIVGRAIYLRGHWYCEEHKPGASRPARKVQLPKGGLAIPPPARMI